MYRCLCTQCYTVYANVVTIAVAITDTASEEEVFDKVYSTIGKLFKMHISI